MPEYEFTDEGLTAALAALGPSAEQVHGTLLRLGFRGRRMSECHSPEARYVLGAFGLTEDEADVSVDPERVAVWRQTWVDEGYGLGHHDDERLHAATPDAVAEFVAAFDDGKYPDLIEEL